jgi:hypothetical protein
VPEADDVTINVIFPIDQQLYDAVMEQAGSAGISLDELYGDACADYVAYQIGFERRSDRALRSLSWTTLVRPIISCMGWAVWRS